MIAPAELARELEKLEGEIHRVLREREALERRAREAEARLAETRAAFEGLTLGELRRLRAQDDAADELIRGWTKAPDKDAKLAELLRFFEALKSAGKNVDRVASSPPIPRREEAGG